MTYKIEVRDNLISVKEAPEITSGNKENIAFEFDFQTGWEEFPLRFCSFIRKGKCCSALIENGICIIPYEFTREPVDFRMGVFGTSQEMEQRISTNLLNFRVEPGAYREDASVPNDPPAEIWEQLILKTVPKIGENNNWFVWDIESQTYKDTGILAGAENAEMTKNKVSAIGAVPSDEKYPSEKAVCDYLEDNYGGGELVVRADGEFSGEYISFSNVSHTYEATLAAYNTGKSIRFVFDADVSGISENFELTLMHVSPDWGFDFVAGDADTVYTVKYSPYACTGVKSDLGVDVVASVSKNTLVLEDKQEAKLAKLTKLILTMPESVPLTYESNFCFISGETATALDYSATTIIWRGDDVNSEGEFVPEANTSYEISVKNLGTVGIVARVGVV